MPRPRVLDPAPGHPFLCVTRHLPTNKRRTNDTRDAQHSLPSPIIAVATPYPRIHRALYATRPPAPKHRRGSAAVPRPAADYDASPPRRSPYRLSMEAKRPFPIRRGRVLAIASLNATASTPSRCCASVAPRARGIYPLPRARNLEDRPASPADSAPIRPVVPAAIRPAVADARPSASTAACTAMGATTCTGMVLARISSIAVSGCSGLFASMARPQTTTDPTTPRVSVVRAQSKLGL
ncbi:hypothetical protein CERZMDRAFT_122536 [Cercospora zeae-maydis SCOH1-5]|uniref:Uncharacterized protein n=1 Tax=Cercospora zeae-maydis SCOH1-5 TaxID=717836 RepID=A0A6A6F465_9PEZI|nr:hypothetical protein CERZMDRAFT_122536 [Cercospora zeae-maydis SCOH1-5]